jgi:hypothetical protein
MSDKLEKLEQQHRAKTLEIEEAVGPGARSRRKAKHPILSLRREPTP